MKKIIAILLMAGTVLSMPMHAMDSGNNNRANQEEVIDPVGSMKRNAKQLKTDLLRAYPSLGLLLVAGATAGTAYAACQSVAKFIGTDMYRFLLINSSTLRGVNLTLWNILQNNLYPVADWLYLQNLIFS